MNFTQFGDANSYIKAGHYCAQAISNHNHIFNDCYNNIRPIGIIFYYALFYLLYPFDYINMYHAILFINIVMVAAIYYILSNAILQCSRNNNFIDKNTFIIKVLFFIAILLNYNMFIPVTMSDLQSILFYIMAFGIAYRILDKSSGHLSYSLYFVMGFLCGIATLMKQNYAVYSLVFIISMLIINKSSAETYKKTSLKFLSYCVGYSMVLIQFIWVFLHSKVFWLYDPKGLAGCGIYQQQPYVELIAYNIPISNSYISTLSTHVSFLSFCVIRLFRGIFHFYYAIYIGKAGPVVINCPFDYLLLMYLCVLFYIALSLYAIIRLPKFLKLLNANALIWSLFNAIAFHTEYRYYIFPRTIFYFMVIFCLYQFLKEKRFLMSILIPSFLKGQRG